MNLELKSQKKVLKNFINAKFICSIKNSLIIIENKKMKKIT